MPTECFVVDTSTMISGLIRSGSPSRALFRSPPGALFAPAAMLDELNDHLDEIARKAALDRATVAFLISVFLSHIQILATDVIEPFWDNAMRIAGSVDPNDAPFVAAYLTIGAQAIISFDKHFDVMGVPRVTPRELLQR